MRSRSVGPEGICGTVVRIWLWPILPGDDDCGRQGRGGFPGSQSPKSKWKFTRASEDWSASPVRGGGRRGRTGDRACTRAKGRAGNRAQQDGAPFDGLDFSFSRWSSFISRPISFARTLSPFSSASFCSTYRFKKLLDFGYPSPFFWGQPVVLSFPLQQYSANQLPR